LVIVAAVAGMGFLLSACGDGAAVAQARTACTHVNKSLALLDKSERESTSDPRQSAQDSIAAQAQLTLALQPATLAAADSAQFAPLATTISERGRVPESRLVQSLTSQCNAVGRGFVPPAPSPGAGKGIPPPGAP
jgi:hypothetical protein